MHIYMSSRTSFVYSSNYVESKPTYLRGLLLGRPIGIPTFRRPRSKSRPIIRPTFKRLVCQNRPINRHTLRKCPIIIPTFRRLTLIFRFSQTRPHWAELVIELPCPCVCLFVCAIGCSFFRGLSLALRSHDQFQASHWSSPPTPPKKKKKL